MASVGSGAPENSFAGESRKSLRPGLAGSIHGICASCGVGRIGTHSADSEVRPGVRVVSSASLFMPDMMPRLRPPPLPAT